MPRARDFPHDFARSKPPRAMRKPRFRPPPLTFP